MGWRVPANMLRAMNQMAAPLARLPRRGAKVGPSVVARSPWRGPGPKTPSHTMGMRTKYSEAMTPAVHIARGWSLVGSRISPMWQAAASKAGAAKPTR